MSKKLFFFFLITITAILIGCKTNPCDTVSCQNGGICNEEDGTCSCPDGFEGDFCQNFIIQKFLGTYQVDYQGCLATTPSHVVTIEQVPDASNKIYINNLGDYACPDSEIKIEALINGTEITIESQELNCGPIVYTFVGTGNFDGTSLTLQFQVSYEVDGFPRTDSCNAKLEQ